MKMLPLLILEKMMKRLKNNFFFENYDVWFKYSLKPEKTEKLKII
jgi:hypothetical protein